ncbi:MAG: hypothetical protein JNK86_01610 [Alphaproteobacteria bacterium]|nr:hypothetical protein [Alphaproteobacteria bacterium]
MFLYLVSKKICCFSVVLALLLSACGFQPLYQQFDHTTAPTTPTASIAIKGLKDRIGHIVYGELSRQLDQSPLPLSQAYTVEIDLDERANDQPLNRSENVIRTTYILTANYRLYQDDRVVFKGSAQSTTNFHLALSGYASYVSREEAELRTATELATIIQQRLRYFLTSTHEN